MNNNKGIGYSSLTGNIYYGLTGIDKDGWPYWKSKQEISKSNFVQVMVDFLKDNSDENDIMTVTKNDETIYEISIKNFNKE